MSTLSLYAYEPIAEAQGLYSRDFIDELTSNHENGNFSISAVGGFEQSTFVLRGTRDYLDDWYNDGILRRIVWYNPEAVQIWEGYVSRMRYVFGDTQKTKTVDGYYNRVYLRYAPLDTSVSPPVAGVPVNIIVDNIDQQLKYGVKSAIISGGERADQTAYDWSRNVLKERSEIPEGDSINTLSSENPGIEIEAKGYYHTLKWLPYIKDATGRIQSHQVIQEVLEYFNGINPGWISQNFGWMDYNFAKATRGYDNLISCWDVIANIIREGGLGGERWIGGLYQNRKMTYKPAEDLAGLYGQDFQYRRALEDPNKFIYDAATGAEVKPWDIVPDRVLHTTDMSLGQRDLMYIESTVFREPYGVQLIGNDDQRLEVFLAQRGLPAI
jgi:hypothetical protein